MGFIPCDCLLQKVHCTPRELKILMYKIPYDLANKVEFSVASSRVACECTRISGCRLSTYVFGGDIDKRQPDIRLHLQARGRVSNQKVNFVGGVN